MLQVIRNIENYKKNNSYKVVTIGNYDGVHAGHKSILSKLVNESKKHNGDSILITFSPHPAEVLVDGYNIDLIQSEKQFIQSLEKESLSSLIIEEFTKEYSQLTAEQFFYRIYDGLKFNKLLIGYDFKFGKDKLGDFDFLYEKSLKYNFELDKIDPYAINNTVVSSTLIRGLIGQGKIKDANQFLGKNYSVTGKVIKGAGKGAEIGFPTLNLDCQNSLFLKLGVYQTMVLFNGKKYNSITNFGRAPTIKNEFKPVLETHILNESIDAYDQSVEIEFFSFIRPELKFSSVEELVVQIKKDINSLS